MGGGEVRGWGWGDGRRTGVVPVIPEMGGRGVYTLKIFDAISVDGERCR